MSEEVKKPVLGITIGDINGVGPEILMRIFSDTRMLDVCIPAIYCNGRIFGFYRKFLNHTGFNYNQVDTIDQAQEGKVNVINCWDEEVEINPGQMTPNGGKYAIISLKAAVEDWKNGRFDALITSPINKKNVADESFNYNGHTRYLTIEAGEKDSLMLMTCKDLKIGVATEHIPLKDISAALTKEVIIEKAKLMHKTLRNDFGIAKPKIALLGLNPHAGDGGLMGMEEIEVIKPAIDELNDKHNIMAIGPYPADGFFGSLEYKHFDGVLAMYHDQGLIPFKTIAFELGVNFTAGMDKIRTSPDHGTAYNIVGKKKISLVSYREAIYLAIDIYNTRNGIIPVQQSAFSFD